MLEKLERALKCKEVWVEGSYAFRNPSEDLPGDWGDEQRRLLHYQGLGQPLEAQAFVRSLRKRLEAALTDFNRVLPGLQRFSCGLTTIAAMGKVALRVGRADGRDRLT